MRNGPSHHPPCPQVGCSEERILRDYHVDAEELYNVTMDLPRVIAELRDPAKRLASRHFQPGAAVKPQLALMVRYDAANSECNFMLRFNPFIP